MKSQELADIIRITNGEPFICTFVKRTTGKTRILHGKTGVVKDLKGVGLKYDKDNKKLLSVFDTEADEYRMIPTDTIISVEVKGKTFEVDIDEYKRINEQK